MNYNPRNYSGLFNLFASDKPDKTGISLQTAGKISFTISFTAGIIATFIKGSGTKISTFLILLFGISFFGGLFAFMATGIYYIGRGKGKTHFLSSTIYVLRNTLLFLFLPVAIITTALIIWAIVTKQPAFR